MDSRSNEKNEIERDCTEEYIPVWKVIGVYVTIVAAIVFVMYKFF